VVFIGDGDKKGVDELLSAAARSGSLTVGDSDPFAMRGGMIQLIKDGNKFRLVINIEAVNRNGLRISSRLRQLADRSPAAGAARSKPRADGFAIFRSAASWVC
jgi:hypothetical protein